MTEPNREPLRLVCDFCDNVTELDAVEQEKIATELRRSRPAAAVKILECRCNRLQHVLRLRSRRPECAR